MGRISLIVALLFCVSLLTSGSASAIQTNKAAPDFSLNDLNGKTVRLGDFSGRVIILNFWSTTCVPCVSEMPGLNLLQRDMGGSGLTVLGISLDRGVKPVRDLVERLRIGYPVLMDSQQEVYFDSYALFGQPVSIIIDRRGVVQEKLIGQIDWSSPSLRARLSSLLKGR